MSKKAVYLAAAKINLSLDILGRRADGYHLMQMVMQSVSLCDRITLSVDESMRNPGIDLKCNKTGIPIGQSNIAYKAAERFYKALEKPPSATVHIEKNIPSEAGMGGGSADGAAVLIGLNELYGYPLRSDELARIGLTIGADLPFCLAGGTKLVEGIGERISNAPSLPDCAFVIAKPAQGVATGPCFQRYDACFKATHPDHANILEALERHDLKGVLSRMKNVLEPAADCPAVSDLRERMSHFQPWGCAMTGSGSAVVAAFPDDAAAEDCLREMQNLEADGVRIYLAHPVGWGVRRERI